MPYSVASVALPRAVGRQGVHAGRIRVDDCTQEAEMLRNVPLFSGLSMSELKLLAFASRQLTFAPGEVLMHQGDRADFAFVILDGEVEVLAETPRGQFLIAVLGRNAMPGEIGVLTDAPRTATVRAKGAVKALRVAPDVFLRLASGRPDRALHVMRQLAAHIANDLHALSALNEELATARADARAARQA